MKGEFQVGRIMGIPIKLHWTLILFLPVLAYLLASQLENIADLPLTGLDPGPLLTPEGRWYAGIVVAIGLFVSVLAHELGHAVVALRHDIEVNQITLWIFGGMAMLKGITKDSKAEAKIAVAGPIVSIALGILPFLVLRVVDPGPYVTFPILYLAYLNIVLAVFNMLPAFPLDGGRLLRALLGMRMPFGKATEIAANIGKAMAVLMGLGGLLIGSIWLILIALFVYMGASQEAQGVELFDALDQIRVSEIMDPEIPAVSPDAYIEELVPLMLRSRTTGFPVVGGDTVVGIVTLSDIQDIPEGERSLVRVSDVMSTDLESIGSQATASEALRRMMEQDIGRLLVVAGDRLEGVVTRQSIMQAFQVLQVLPRINVGETTGRRPEGFGDSPFSR